MLRAALACAAFLCVSSARAETNDDALSEIAAELLLEEGAGALRTEALLRASRSTLPSVRVLRAAASDTGARRRFVDGLEARARGLVVCGEAVSSSARLVVCGERLASLDVGARGHVRVSLDGAASAPLLYHLSGAGTVSLVGFGDALVRGEVTLSDVQRAAPATLQLVARFSDGPRPVAELCLGECPRFDGRSTLEGSITELRPLRANALLARAATAHAERVCEDARVAHELDPGRDPTARLRSAGVMARVVGETVARAENEAGAIAAILSSPSHRATLTDRRFTDFGVGRAHDSRGALCVVALFAAWPRASAE